MAEPKRKMRLLIPKPALTDREELILQLHYADGWPLRRIARGIGVDHVSVTRSHRRALEVLALQNGGISGPTLPTDVSTNAHI